MEMKILLGEGLTTFSGKALLFEPPSSATGVGYNMMTKQVSYVTPTKECQFLISDHVGHQDTKGILHVKCLKDLCSTHSTHFAKVYSMAEQGRLNLYNTFLYESPEHTTFPSNTEELIQKFATKELLASKYEQLYGIGSYATYIEQYFERMVTQETVKIMVEFCNTLTSYSGLKTFLASHITKKCLRWQIHDAH